MKIKTKNGMLINSDCVVGMKKLGERSVDIVFTSPPYNRIRNDKYKNYNDNNMNYYDLLIGFTDEALRISRGYVIVNLQQNHFNKKEFFSYLGNYAKKINGIITWEKTNPQPSTNYREDSNNYSITNAVEHFIVLGDGKSFRANNPVKNIISTSVNSERFEGHGAVMKRDVARWFIDQFTREGDVVCDPFSGIGTTWVVCEEKGRKFIGFELSSEYCEMTHRRLTHEFPSLSSERLD